MATRNRIFTITVIVLVLLAIGIAVYALLPQITTPPHSLLLYTSRQSPETITNWIMDTDTGEKWEVGKGLAAWHWSPSGKYLVFHTLSPLPRQIWISNNDGSNLHLVLDSKDYPDLEIKDFDWLTDKEIIVNVVSKTENSGFVYLFNVDTRSFKKLNVGNFMRVSPNGKFWVQWTNKDNYHLMDLRKNISPLTLDLVGELYFFSPNGNQWAYFCNRKENSYSLCLADVDISGVKNEHKIADVETPVVGLDIWWSQDGKYIGIQTYNRTTYEIRFRAIDISSGAIAYDWIFPTKDTRNFWSPRGDKIIDWGGLLLDLKTGQVSNFFAEIGETAPSYIVDWRLIQVP